MKDIGEVEHLVLPVTALEHKAFFGPFQRQFPSASVWAAPGQYGPFGTLGFEPASSTLPFRVDGVLPRTKKDKQPDWASATPPELQNSIGSVALAATTFSLAGAVRRSLPRTLRQSYISGLGNKSHLKICVSNRIYFFMKSFLFSFLGRGS